MANSTEQGLVDKAVGDGGSYEIIRARLLEQAERLEQITSSLNTARAEEFGSTDMAVRSRTRVRTENNCIGRDIVQLGQQLLFGYNVFIGLKPETRVEDVFALYDFSEEDGSVSLSAVPVQGSFLEDQRFRADFDELYRYYTSTRLMELVLKGSTLLAAFQIGDRLDDVRVFRWQVSSGGDQGKDTVQYMDNRGERDYELPKTHDFNWIATRREDIVQGRHPHVNIANKLFVETLGGTLTIKVENNTQNGEGIFSEPVDEPNQSLNDADIAYALVGDLILLRVLPYKESQTRYLIYNPLNQAVIRQDNIGDSCQHLPEDHGLIFPDGYYLATGEHKSFEIDVPGLRFKRRLQSPNGEDVLYIFYEPEKGVFALLSYNLITKSLQNPIETHGYALASDGTAVVFTADDEPSRMHPMQIWDTPYVSEEHASTVPSSHSFFSRIGNAELVRGVSDLYSICRAAREGTVSAKHYELLSRASGKMFDDHYWIDEEQTQGAGALVRQIGETVELIVDEFEKVQGIQQHSAKALAEAREQHASLLAVAGDDAWGSVDEYVEVLDRIRRQRGHLTSIGELRYIDTSALEQMDVDLVALNERVSQSTAQFLSKEDAFNTYQVSINELELGLESHKSVASLKPDLEELEDIATGLDLLSELISGLKIDDPTVQTDIVDRISEVYAQLNRTRALGSRVRENMGSAEAVEQFAAQFKLFSQSVVHALGLATDPERCDEQLTRLLVQLEEIEGQFGEHERFLVDILDKREEVNESFAVHKQQLLDARQARAQTLADASERMLANIDQRAQRFEDMDALNTYLASDALVLKSRDIALKLRDLGSTVKADEVDSRLKMIRDLAMRSLRDRSDLYSDGGKSIKLGQHVFSVNVESLELTIIPRGEQLSLHLVGTRYFEPMKNAELDTLRHCWQQAVVSESDTVYRGEYLAYCILDSARNGHDELDWAGLLLAHKEQTLDELVRSYAAPRYREGYQKGVHDADAALILGALVPVFEAAGLLRHAPDVRALALLYWSDIDAETKVQRARTLVRLRDQMSAPLALSGLQTELVEGLGGFAHRCGFELSAAQLTSAAVYLSEEMGANEDSVIVSSAAADLLMLSSSSACKPLTDELLISVQSLQERPDVQWQTAKTFLAALIRNHDRSDLERYLPEAAALLLTGPELSHRVQGVNLEIAVDELLGEHASIENGRLQLALDDFLERLDDHAQRVIPDFNRYQALRKQLASDARDQLRLDEFKPKPLSSFVRNKLINEAYLPLIGANLAKQIGTVGEGKRSDLNGLLMMISPPGYGKTTLMEYTAHRLGLTFMKINCPSLGHDTVSVDPATASNATARQELEKLNLALEMGDNVMLYLDDIQHTHPEFLQKFISLCDSTRRMEGVWRGVTRTYDLRGRKFCIVMAGNPYTESGETFRVPDMLANRADIYNLGDILSGTERQFELSYLENGLSSNPILAPLGTRDMDDVYKLIDMARGREVASSDLSHAYSGAEINEIKRVFTHLFSLRDTVLAVNQQYIASAAQDDKYRTEPRFLLQGSYRNMNKLAEKVSAAMNEKELDDLIEDHYRGEAQLLTQGAEANLLKLSELRGTLTEEEASRLAAIREDFMKEKALGGDSSDVGQRVVAQLGGLADAVKAQQQSVTVRNEPSPEFSKMLATLNDTIETTLFPLVRSMDTRISQDVEAHAALVKLIKDVESLKRFKTKLKANKP